MSRDGASGSGGWVSEEIRIRVAREIVNGVVGAAQAARTLGVTRQATSGWAKKYREGGVEALREKPIPGRPPKLSDGQAADIYARIDGRTPRDFGMPYSLWTRALVGQLIYQEYGVRMTPQAVGGLLNALGMSVQRPLYRAIQRDPDAAETWRAETFPAIRAQAAKVGAKIYFGDEAAVRSDHHAGGTWSPRGRTPVVPKTGERFTVNMISAINQLGHSHFSIIDGYCDSDAFIQFCTGLMADVDAPVFLVVDNASYHRSEAVRKFVAESNGMLRIIRLSSYSPELNPDELVWRDIKVHDIGRAAVRGHSEMVERIFARALRLYENPEIIRSYFRTPNLIYANV
jgi:transposase